MAYLSVFFYYHILVYGIRDVLPRSGQRDHFQKKYHHLLSKRAMAKLHLLDEASSCVHHDESLDSVAQIVEISAPPSVPHEWKRVSIRKVGIIPVKKGRQKMHEYDIIVLFERKENIQAAKQEKLTRARDMGVREAVSHFLAYPSSV